MNTDLYQSNVKIQGLRIEPLTSTSCIDMDACSRGPVSNEKHSSANPWRKYWNIWIGNTNLHAYVLGIYRTSFQHNLHVLSMHVYV